MKDHTIVELAGMGCVTIICVAGVIVDGDVGNAVSVAGASALSAFVGYIAKAYSGGKEDVEEEVQKSG